VRTPVEYLGVEELRGPLLVVRGVAGVGWDEFAEIRLADGETRHGLVLAVDRDLAVVQVLEGTQGIEPARTRVSFAGEPLAIPVGEGWLGRVCNGRGEPLDGGPPVFGTTTAPTNGVPLNPTRRQPPADPVLTGISAIDALTTLVRGQKLPVFSVPGFPHLELAAQIAAQASPRPAASPSPSCSPRWGFPTPTPNWCATPSRTGRPPANWCSWSTPPTTRSSSGCSPRGWRSRSPRTWRSGGTDTCSWSWGT
jgi:vacuolar-type H+-ATPase subunit B/Vma2